MLTYIISYVASERTIINRGAASKDTTKKTKKQDGWAPKKYKNADDEGMTNEGCGSVCV